MFVERSLVETADLHVVDRDIGWHPSQSSIGMRGSGRRGPTFYPDRTPEVTASSAKAGKRASHANAATPVCV